MFHVLEPYHRFNPLFPDMIFVSFLPKIVTSSSWTSQNTVSAVLLSAIIGPAIIAGAVLFLCSYIVFSANVIQFGVDQLIDSPSDDSETFIHLYVLITCIGLVLSRFLTIWIVNIVVIPLAVLGLGVTLIVGHRKRHWFLVEPASRNPYKLVYRVIKFAIKHKNPIQRSAFTYCEDELPSRIDLGKAKYGGPFTSEQVEDVKAFLGILSILFTLGPVFAVEVAAGDIVSKIAIHMDGTKLFSLGNSAAKDFFFSTGIITSLAAIFFIVLYLGILRKCARDYIPGMLKRMGMGMFFRMLSALSTLAMDTVGHVRNANVTSCFLSSSSYHGLLNGSVTQDSSVIVPMNINSALLVIQNILNAISYVLVYNAAFGFICAQSPHAMKGLLIGIFFAVDGLFQLLEVLLLLIPFNWWKLNSNFPSCAFVYYLVNAAFVFIGFVAYTQAARKYQYRQRDEPDNIYRYAEDYYEKSPEESADDYSSLTDSS